MKTATSAAVLPVDSPARRRLPILLRHAWYGLNQAFRRRIAHTGVTPDQFTVLRTLSETKGPGLTQRQLTERMRSDPNTIASLIHRMETAGLIERRPHETDRRAHRIQLGPTGRLKYKIARAIAVDLQTRVLGCLPEQDRERFLDMLEAVASAAGVAADEVVQNRT